MAFRSSTTGAASACVFERVTRETALSALISRRDVAKLAGLHQDSISRLLVDGLAGAVIEWGGHGREMRFSKQLVGHWLKARACRRRGERGCRECLLKLENFEASGEHLLDVRHGAHESCGTGDDECGYGWAEPIATNGLFDAAIAGSDEPS
jgi:hypothetical protein